MSFFQRTTHFIKGSYNLLLPLLILLFLFRPFRVGEVYPGIWKFVLTISLLLAIFDVHHRKWVKIIAVILSIPSIALSWIFLFTHSPFFEFLVILSTTAFLLICTCSIIYDVVARARVTMETLRGVVCAYFLIAFAFAYLYTLIELFFHGSFASGGVRMLDLSIMRYFAEMLYFSFVTLLTIGYGDIVAVRELAQTAVVIEGIVGQFYIAILVARIVSVYSFYSDKRLLQEIEKKRQ